MPEEKAPCRECGETERHFEDCYFADARACLGGNCDECPIGRESGCWCSCHLRPAEPSVCPQCQSEMETQQVCEHCGHREPVNSQPRWSGNCKTPDGEHDTDCPYFPVDSLRAEGLGVYVDYERDPASGEVFTIQKLAQSPREAPERIWLRKVERDGHQVWMEASGTDEGEFEFIRKK